MAHLLVSLTSCSVETRRAGHREVSTCGEVEGREHGTERLTKSQLFFLFLLLLPASLPSLCSVNPSPPPRSASLELLTSITSSNNPQHVVQLLRLLQKKKCRPSFSISVSSIPPLAPSLPPHPPSLPCIGQTTGPL